MATSKPAPADSKPDNLDEGALPADAKTTEQNVFAQKVIDEENKNGYRGVEVDQTPNEHYTVEGVTAGKPVPETDPDRGRLGQHLY